MSKYFRDTVSGFTHMGGAIAAIIGTIFLVIRAKSGIELFSYILFGISMIMLFSASATYHLTTGPKSLVSIMRKIDHSMIFVLIAGTYTPVVLQAFTGGLKWGYICGLWLVAIVGTTLKIFFTGKFRVLFTIIYILMGWSGTVAILPLSKGLGTNGMIILFLGGLFYTTGGIIYALKKPKLWNGFGFHELFHIFVLLGAIAMFFVIYLYC